MSEHLPVGPELIEWLAGGERGISSNAIVHQLTGLETSTFGWYADHPHDPGDFKRCEKLLRAVPSLRPELHRMEDVSPIWAALVDHWDAISTLLIAEIPGIYEGERGSAPETYRLMRKIIEEAQS